MPCRLYETLRESYTKINTLRDVSGCPDPLLRLLVPWSYISVSILHMRLLPCHLVISKSYIAWKFDDLIDLVALNSWRFIAKSVRTWEVEEKGREAEKKSRIALMSYLVDRNHRTFPTPTIRLKASQTKCPSQNLYSVLINRHNVLPVTASCSLVYHLVLLDQPKYHRLDETRDVALFATVSFIEFIKFMKQR